MSRWLLPLAGVVVVLGLIAGPVLLAARQQAQTRNFRVVRPGVLYRSGQMTIAGLRRAIHDCGIRTVVNLRDGSTGPDRVEEEFCANEEIGFLRIPPRRWWGEGERVPAEEGIRKFLAVLAEPHNHPVLVHCFAGVHRTGAYVAVYRMEFEGWTNEQAIAEVKAGGYSSLDEELDVLGFLEHYRPRTGRKGAQP
jgi:tyrosine-protein phosphatase SIW14